MTSPKNWNMPELTGASSVANSQVTYTELKDTLPIRGTEFLIRVPDKWNGTLISDLDYHTSGDSPRNLALLERGYALSGTGRRPDRLTHYDPAHEIHDLVTVMHIFESAFEKPAQTIQLGCSGGGAVTLAMAEIHPDRIDGAIAACASTSPWMANTHLDGLFVLKALLAPHLPIVNLPLEDPEISEIGNAWQRVINEAQQTPEGRARITLAMTIGQWPAWGGPGEAPLSEPDPLDIHTLQESMYRSLVLLLPSKVTFGTSMLEHAGSGQLRWNTGIDYATFYRNGNAQNKEAVEALYQEAGLCLEDDLDQIDAFPRVVADPAAIKWWSSPGRTHIGEPKAPLLRLHTNGDGLVYPAMAQGYEELVGEKGYTALFRLAYVNRWGHCTFSLAEWLAAIETMMLRLDTGVWPSTSPEALNQLGASLDSTSSARFCEHTAVKRYNRIWFPQVTDF